MPSYTKSDTLRDILLIVTLFTSTVALFFILCVRSETWIEDTTIHNITTPIVTPTTSTVATKSNLAPWPLAGMGQLNTITNTDELYTLDLFPTTVKPISKPLDATPPTNKFIQSIMIPGGYGMIQGLPNGFHGLASWQPVALNTSTRSTFQFDRMIDMMADTKGDCSSAGIQIHTNAIQVGTALTASSDALKLFVTYESAYDLDQTSLLPFNNRRGLIAMYTRASNTSTNWTFQCPLQLKHPFGQVQMPWVSDRFGCSMRYVESLSSSYLFTYTQFATTSTPALVIWQEQPTGFQLSSIIEVGETAQWSNSNSNVEIDQKWDVGEQWLVWISKNGQELALLQQDSTTRQWLTGPNLITLTLASIFTTLPTSSSTTTTTTTDLTFRSVRLDALGTGLVVTTETGIYSAKYEINSETNRGRWKWVDQYLFTQFSDSVNGTWGRYLVRDDKGLVVGLSWHPNTMSIDLPDAKTTPRPMVQCWKWNPNSKLFDFSISTRILQPWNAAWAGSIPQPADPSFGSSVSITMKENGLYNIAYIAAHSSLNKMIQLHTWT